MTVFAFSLLGAVENSITPVIDYFECIENLQQEKYNEAQFKKIENGLCKKCKKIRVMTYNMLFDLFDHNLAPVNRWPARLPRIVALINEMNPDVIGTQELQPNQVQDLVPLLAPTYTFFSVNSSTGDQDGIFIKKKRFHIHKKELVFSESDPETPVITIVELKDKKTAATVAIANSHFSFSNVENRGLEAHLVAKKVHCLSKHIPVIFMGDLNTFPNRPDNSFPFYDGDYVNDILTKNTLQDSIDVSLVGHVGPISTFTNNPPSILPFEGTGTPGVFLDHMYVSNGITVLIHAVQPGTVDGHFPSDHMPVVIDCVVERCRS